MKKPTTNKSSNWKWKRLLALLIAMIVTFSNAEVALAAFTGVVPDVSAPTSYTEVYERIMAYQEIIPEGTLWTDYTPYDNTTTNAYYWKGGKIDGKIPLNYGCMALTAILSDVAFGSLPATKKNRGSFTFEEVRVGDILRVDNDFHSVIVLQTTPAGVVIAEGNYAGKVHWERTLSKQDVLFADFILTRYPKGFVSADEAGANDIVDQGKEANLSWTLTKRGVLTITGSGAMPNFSVNDGYMPSWSKTTHPIHSVVIWNGITSIGDFAFYGSTALSVSIPSSVTKIGDNAFYKSSLIGVTIPGSVKTIGYQSFCDCKNLAELKLAEGTTTIGDNAFRGCTSMNYILNIPASVTSVGDSAFLSCSELMSVQFKDSNHAVTIGDNAFCQCWKMLSIKLPNKLTNISSGMLYGCKMLGYLYIPASVQEISIVDGDPIKTPPFMSSSISQIDFGGSELTWQAIGGKTALNDAHMVGVTVNFNVPPTTNPDTGDTGNTGENPGNTGENPGNTGENPGNTGENPGNTGENPGNTGENPGNTGDNPSVSPGDNSGGNPGNTGNTTTSNKKEKVTKYYKQKIKGNKRIVYNSKGKQIDYCTLKKGELTYKGKKIKYKGKKITKIKYSDFNQVGNIIVICKDSKLTYYKVAKNTGKVTKLGTKAKSRKTKRGLVTHIVKKNGKKQNVAKK